MAVPNQLIHASLNNTRVGDTGAQGPQGDTGAQGPGGGSISGTFDNVNYGGLVSIIMNSAEASIVYAFEGGVVTVIGVTFKVGK